MNDELNFRKLKLMIGARDWKWIFVFDSFSRNLIDRD